MAANSYETSPLNWVRTPKSTWQYGAEISHWGTGESGAKRAFARDRRIELRQVRPQLAVVGDGLSRAHPADDREDPYPQVERRVDAVE